MIPACFKIFDNHVKKIPDSCDKYIKLFSCLPSNFEQVEIRVNSIVCDH